MYVFIVRGESKGVVVVAKNGSRDGLYSDLTFRFTMSLLTPIGIHELIQ